MWFAVTSKPAEESDKMSYNYQRHSYRHSYSHPEESNVPWWQQQHHLQDKTHNTGTWGGRESRREQRARTFRDSRNSPVFKSLPYADGPPPSVSPPRVKPHGRYAGRDKVLGDENQDGGYGDNEGTLHHGDNNGSENTQESREIPIHHKPPAHRASKEPIYAYPKRSFHPRYKYRRYLSYDVDDDLQFGSSGHMSQYGGYHDLLSRSLSHGDSLQDPFNTGFAQDFGQDFGQEVGPRSEDQASWLDPSLRDTYLRLFGGSSIGGSLEAMTPEPIRRRTDDSPVRSHSKDRRNHRELKKFTPGRQKRHSISESMFSQEERSAIFGDRDRSFGSLSPTGNTSYGLDESFGVTQGERREYSYSSSESRSFYSPPRSIWSDTRARSVPIQVVHAVQKTDRTQDSEGVTQAEIHPIPPQTDDDKYLEDTTSETGKTEAMYGVPNTKPETGKTEDTYGGPNYVFGVPIKPSSNKQDDFIQGLENTARAYDFEDKGEDFYLQSHDQQNVELLKDDAVERQLDSIQSQISYIQEQMEKLHGTTPETTTTSLQDDQSPLGEFNAPITKDNVEAGMSITERGEEINERQSIPEFVQIMTGDMSERFLDTPLHSDLEHISERRGDRCSMDTCIAQHSDDTGISNIDPISVDIKAVTDQYKVCEVDSTETVRRENEMLGTENSYSSKVQPIGAEETIDLHISEVDDGKYIDLEEKGCVTNNVFIMNDPSSTVSKVSKASKEINESVEQVQDTVQVSAEAAQTAQDDREESQDHSIGWKLDYVAKQQEHEYAAKHTQEGDHVVTESGNLKSTPESQYISNQAEQDYDSKPELENIYTKEIYHEAVSALPCEEYVASSSELDNPHDQIHHDNIPTQTDQTLFQDHYSQDFVPSQPAIDGATDITQEYTPVQPGQDPFMGQLDQSYFGWQPLPDNDTSTSQAEDASSSDPITYGAKSKVARQGSLLEELEQDYASWQRQQGLIPSQTQSSGVGFTKQQAIDFLVQKQKQEYMNQLLCGTTPTDDPGQPEVHFSPTYPGYVPTEPGHGFVSGQPEEQPLDLLVQKQKEEYVSQLLSRTTPTYDPETSYSPTSPRQLCVQTEPGHDYISGKTGEHHDSGQPERFSFDSPVGGHYVASPPVFDYASSQPYATSPLSPLNTQPYVTSPMGSLSPTSPLEGYSRDSIDSCFTREGALAYIKGRKQEKLQKLLRKHIEEPGPKVEHDYFAGLRKVERKPLRQEYISPLHQKQDYEREERYDSLGFAANPYDVGVTAPLPVSHPNDDDHDVIAERLDAARKHRGEMRAKQYVEQAENLARQNRVAMENPDVMGTVSAKDYVARAEQVARENMAARVGVEATESTGSSGVARAKELIARAERIAKENLVKGKIVPSDTEPTNKLEVEECQHIFETVNVQENDMVQEKKGDVNLTQYSDEREVVKVIEDSSSTTRDIAIIGFPSSRDKTESNNSGISGKPYRRKLDIAKESLTQNDTTEQHDTAQAYDETDRSVVIKQSHESIAEANDALHQTEKIINTNQEEQKNIPVHDITEEEDMEEAAPRLSRKDRSRRPIHVHHMKKEKIRGSRGIHGEKYPGPDIKEKSEVISWQPTVEVSNNPPEEPKARDIPIQHIESGPSKIKPPKKSMLGKSALRRTKSEGPVHRKKIYSEVKRKVVFTKDVKDNSKDSKKSKKKKVPTATLR